MNTNAVAFLNDRWISASDAKVSVGDAGFVQGTTIAEQLRTFAGKIFHLDGHLKRLMQSLDVLGLDPGIPATRLAEIAEEIVLRNHALLEPGDDLGVSILATPGPYASYAPSEAIRPTVCVHTYALPFHHWVDKYRDGQALMTTEVQQVPPQCWPPNVKCRSRMHYYLADHKAAAAEPGSRALLLDADGFVTEASTANVLIFKNNEGFVSPPLAKVLPGISLTAIAELAGKFNVPMRERDLTADDIAQADEVLLASTPFCLLPVTRFNRKAIADGKPGPMFQQLLAAWSDTVGIDILAQAERFRNRNQ